MGDAPHPLSKEFIEEKVRLAEEAEAWLAKNIRMALVIPRDKMKALWPGGMSLEGHTVTNPDGSLRKIDGNVKPVIEKLLPKTKILGCEITGNSLYITLDEE